MAVITKCLTILTASPAVDHGMSRRYSVAVPRGCGCWDQIRMSLRGFGWSAISRKIFELPVFAETTEYNRYIPHPDVSLPKARTYARWTLFHKLLKCRRAGI